MKEKCCGNCSKWKRDREKRWGWCLIVNEPTEESLGKDCMVYRPRKEVGK